MTLTERLKRAVADGHARIEGLPLAAAMLAGRLPRDAYLALLGELELIHGPLEAELAARPGAVPVYRPAMARAELLRRDRAALGGDPPPAPLADTQELVERIGTWAAETPAALIGVLYVFEGSRMGSLVLARRLAASLGVPAEPGRGLDYHLDGAADRPRQWGRLKGELDALPLTAEQQDAVVAAAAEAMDRLCGVYAALPCAEPAAV